MDDVTRYGELYILDEELYHNVILVHWFAELNYGEHSRKLISIINI